MFGIDETDRIAFATEALTTMLETTPAEIVGLDVGDLVAPDDADVFRDAVRDVRESADEQCLSRRVHLSRNDEHVPVIVEFTAPDSAMVICTADDYHSSTNRFRHLFENIHDAAVMFELDGLTPVVRAINPAFAETFGVDPAEIVGDSLNDHIVPDGRVSEAVDYDQRTARGQSNYAIVSRISVDGHREFIYRGLPFEFDDGSRYGFAVYTDVTDDRRRQRRLHVLHRVLRHNLRNDLSVVFGMAEYVRETATDDEIVASAERILDAADRLSSVSEQAREIETALDGDFDRSVDAAALVRSIVADYRSVTPIETSLPERAPVTGGVGLYGAIDNLVENAIEHTPDGTQITVSIVHEDEKRVITVADDGDGIPDVERAAVFDDADITNLRHGSGLGIWLARWVAEAAGGGIDYQRRDGWTTVSLRLPVSEAEDVIVPEIDDAVSEQLDLSLYSAGP